MNKKFMALPVIGIVVAMLGASVFAASPSTGILVKATAGDGTDLLTEDPTHGKIVIVDGQDDQNVMGKKGTDLISADLINSTVNNSKFDASSFTVVKVFDAHYEVGGVPTALPADFVVQNSLSPFAIIKATAATSAQTGEYAGAYIIMVAVALTACGAVFAIRAKKASK